MKKLFSFLYSKKKISKDNFNFVTFNVNYDIKEQIAFIAQMKGLKHYQIYEMIMLFISTNKNIINNIDKAYHNTEESEYVLRSVKIKHKDLLCFQSLHKKQYDKYHLFKTFFEIWKDRNLNQIEQKQLRLQFNLN